MTDRARLRTAPAVILAAILATLAAFALRGTI